jgi:hypothetical protein
VPTRERRAATPADEASPAGLGARGKAPVRKDVDRHLAKKNTRPLALSAKERTRGSEAGRRRLAGRPRSARPLDSRFALSANERVEGSEPGRRGLAGRPWCARKSPGPQRRRPTLGVKKKARRNPRSTTTQSDASVSRERFTRATRDSSDSWSPKKGVSDHPPSRPPPAGARAPRRVPLSQRRRPELCREKRRRREAGRRLLRAYAERGESPPLAHSLTFVLSFFPTPRTPNGPPPRLSALRTAGDESDRGQPSPSTITTFVLFSFPGPNAFRVLRGECVSR